MSEINKQCSCGQKFRNAFDIIALSESIIICSGGMLWFNCKKCDSTNMLPKGSFPPSLKNCSDVKVMKTTKRGDA